jgi:hypothetical protein
VLINSSTFSGVGASGNPGAVQNLDAEARLVNVRAQRPIKEWLRMQLTARAPNKMSVIDEKFSPFLKLKH